MLFYQRLFRIKSWKLTILAFIIISILSSLGFWQLNRAHYKTNLLNSFATRSTQTPLTLAQLKSKNDLRFYRATLSGHYDNQHTILLDNKTFHGQVGYEVYTPFITSGLGTTTFLIDRGFMPRVADRAILPQIPKLTFELTNITGMLNLPPRYFALGKISETQQLTWPLRVQYIELSELQEILHSNLFPYLLSLDSVTAHSINSKVNSKQFTNLAIEWNAVTVSPERHMGYAVQWFALALTLLILSVALNYK